MKKLISLLLILLLFTACEPTSNQSGTGWKATSIDKGFIFGNDTDIVPIWVAPGALNNEANTQPRNFVLNEPLPVEILERQAFKTGSVYFKVQFFDAQGNQVIGWVARIYLFRDTNAVVYFEGNKLTGETVWSDNPYFSIPVRQGINSGTCMHLEVPQTIEREKNKGKGKFETSKEHVDRINSLKVGLSHWTDKVYTYTKKSLSETNIEPKGNRKFAYDIEKHLATIEVTDQWDFNYPTFDMRDDDCKTSLGFPSVNYFDDYESRIYRLYTYFTLTNLGELKKPFVSTERKISVVISIDIETARIIDEGSLWFLYGFDRLKLDRVEKTTESRESSSTFKTTNNIYGKSYFKAGLAYILVYSESLDQTIAAFTSNRYSNSGLVRDLQITLTKLGYYAGEIDGVESDSLKHAITKAKEGGAISDKSTTYPDVLGKLLLASVHP